MEEDSGVPMTIVMVVCTIATFLFMALRFYCKLLRGRKLGSDDYILVLSWVLHLVFVVLSIVSTRYGLGKRLQDLNLALLPELLRLLPIGQFFAVIAVAVSKTSFILTLLQLVHLTWHKAALWFMLVTINASMGSISIVQFFQCPAVETPGCVAGNHVIGLGVFAAGYSAVMDLVLTVFPSLVIWRLQMKTKEKVGIILSMSLGIIAGVVGLYKTSTIPLIARSSDFTHGTAIVLIWLVAEVTATILAACIPFFRPLIRRAGETNGSGVSKDAYNKNSYGMSRRIRTGNGGHAQLGSQTDPKGGGDPNHDYSSDRDMLPSSTSGKILRQTEVTVEYDTYAGTGQEPRRNMF